MEYGELNKITIIGPGSLGTLFKQSLETSGKNHTELIGKGEKLTQLHPLVIICVPDSEIITVAQEIAENHPSLEGKIIMHCSGTVEVSALRAVKEIGAVVGCMHPMMAVTETSSSFRGVTFDVCGSPDFVEVAQSLGSQLDAKTVVVDEAQKKKLHIASVVASNYLVTLMHIAEEIAESGHPPNDPLNQALRSLMQSALDNLGSSSPTKALTGPIARGDAETVSDHLQILQNDHPNLLDLYQKLGLITVDMVSDRLSEQKKDELIRLFNDRQTK